MRRIKYLIMAALLLSVFLVNENRQDDMAMSSTYKYKKYVALTFDDGPHARYTEILLDGLKERNVVATFFLVGKNIEGNEDLVWQMHEDGHCIGNHTFSHIDLSSINENKANEEIDKTNEIIYGITGKKPKYIRPPFGSVYKEASIDDLTVVMWSLDTKDWVGNDAKIIAKNVVENVEDGDIILLHDIFLHSVSAAFEIIDQLSQRGFEFVSVEDLIIE